MNVSVITPAYARLGDLLHVETSTPFTASAIKVGEVRLAAFGTEIPNRVGARLRGIAPGDYLVTLVAPGNGQELPAGRVVITEH